MCVSVCVCVCVWDTEGERMPHNNIPLCKYKDGEIKECVCKAAAEVDMRPVSTHTQTHPPSLFLSDKTTHSASLSVCSADAGFDWDMAKAEEGLQLQTLTKNDPHSHQQGCKFGHSLFFLQPLSTSLIHPSIHHPDEEMTIIRSFRHRSKIKDKNQNVSGEI